MTQVIGALFNAKETPNNAPSPVKEIDLSADASVNDLSIVIPATPSHRNLFRWQFFKEFAYCMPISLRDNFK